MQTNIENPLEKPIVSLPVHVEEFSSKVCERNYQYHNINLMSLSDKRPIKSTQKFDNYELL